MKPNTQTAVATTAKPSLIRSMAETYSIEPDKFLNVLRNTAFKDANDDQLMALCIVAHQYGLNPLTKEIYAYPDKKNGIVPVVGIDGWYRRANENPKYKGHVFIESENWVESPQHKSCPEWIECQIHVEGRNFPACAREYFDECYRPPFKGTKDGRDYEINGPWQTHTKRLLRHKAFIQACRMAFGFAGIRDDLDGEPPMVITSLPEPSIPVESQVVREQPKPSTFTAREQLEIVLHDAKFEFSDFKTWAIKESFLQPEDKSDCCSDIPDELAKRILRAKDGMLKGIEQVKGGAQ